MVVLVALLMGTAVILSGTPYFGQMLPLLFAAVFWFIVVVPGAYFWIHQKSDHPLPTGQ